MVVLAEVLQLAAAAALIAGLPRVEGTTTCPSPEQVRSEMATMFRDDVVIEERVILRDLGEGVGVELLRPSGEEVVRRYVPGTQGCPERAKVVAVVLAVALQQVHPELQPKIPPIEPPPDRGAWAQPSRPVVFRHDLDLGLGLGASLADGAAALAGIAQLNFFAPEGGLGVFAGLALDGARDVPFQLQASLDRAARWRRIPILFGPAWRFARARWNLDLRVLGVVGWTGVEGRNFVSSGEAERWTLASAVGARASTRTGVIVSWVDVTMSFWPSQRAEALQAPEVVDLPRFCVLLSLGAGLCTRCQDRTLSRKETTASEHVVRDTSMVLSP